jgi:hypothetical protein
MPRVLCTEIEWDTPDKSLDLPDEVEMSLDHDYDPTYEPALSLSREFGTCVISFSVEVITNTSNEPR